MSVVPYSIALFVYEKPAINGDISKVGCFLDSPVDEVSAVSYGNQQPRRGM